MIHERFFVEDMKTQEARFVGTSANHRHCITLVLFGHTKYNGIGRLGTLHDIDFNSASLFV